MTGSIAIPMCIRGFTDIGGRDVAVFGEPIGERFLIIQFGRAVELGAIACRQNRDFADRRKRMRQIPMRLQEPFSRKGDTLPQIDGCCAKVEAVRKNRQLPASVERTAPSYQRLRRSLSRWAILTRYF